LSKRIEPEQGDWQNQGIDGSARDLSDPLMNPDPSAVPVPVANVVGGGDLVRHQDDPHNRVRLRWRARRGLLENDLILTRFLDAHELALSDAEVDALTRLLEASDNDLLDLLLARKEAQGELDLPHVHALLVRLRLA
jgi:antitoxin CptB